MKHYDIHLGIGERQRVSQAFPERQISVLSAQFAGYRDEGRRRVEANDLRHIGPSR